MAYKFFYLCLNYELTCQFIRKMIKTVYLLLLFLPVSLYGFNVTKEVEEQYPKEGISSLSITNSYGNIMFLPSTSDSIKIQASVIADVIEMNDTSEIFRYIDPNMYTSTNSLVIKTIYNPDLDNSALAGVHYTIYIPDSLDLFITNRYGNISLFNIYGTKEIELEYGKLECEDLPSPIDAKTTINLTFASFTGGKVDSTELHLNNSSVVMKEMGGCLLHSSYSVFDVKTIKSLKASSETDKFEIGTINSFSVSAKNTVISVTTLNNYLEADINGGKLNVSNVSNGFTGINLNLQKAETELKLMQEASYFLNASIEYGNFVYPKNLDLEIVEDIDKTIFKGKYGQQETKSQIGIISYNSSIKIK